MADRIIFGADSIDVVPGSYPATCTGIATKTSDAFGDFRAWEFELATGATIGGATSMSMHPKSNGGKWAVALLGRMPAKGEDITEALVGRPCIVSIVESPNGWPKVAEVLTPMTQAAAGDVDELPY